MDEGQVVGYVVGDDVTSLDQPIYILSAAPADPPEMGLDGEWELAGVESYALSPINPSDTSGLKKILLEILGPYDNIATQFKYQQQNNSYYTYVNEITPDYPWICSALLFIVLVISVFRLIRSTLWKQ